MYSNRRSDDAASGGGAQPVKWKTTKHAGVECAACGTRGTCTVSPDGTAFKCWRDGGKVHQTRPFPRLADHGLVKPKRAAPKDGKTFTTAELAVEAARKQVEKSRGQEATLSGSWSYLQPGNAEVMRVLRYDLADGDKQFRPIHPHKNGWRIGDPQGLLPLYRLNELPQTGRIFVCEGEKAADAAALLGLAATTSAHGSNAVEKTDWTPLAGREVVILPDNDEPGEKYSRAVQSALMKLNARVRETKLPNLPIGGDVVEFVASGGTRDLIEVMVASSQVIDPADVIGGAVLVCMADVTRVPVEWLWPGRVPLGRLTVLAGMPGCGKSFTTIDMVSRVTTGSPWPDGSGRAPRGSSLLIVAEDNPADTIGPRLDAAYADSSKVHVLTMVKKPTDGGMVESPFSLGDIFALEQSLKRLPDCRLVVIDPIGSFLGGRVDAHRDNEVRAVLAPVAALAETYNVAVLVVAHVRKAFSSAADDGVLGSRAFTGIARAVWHLSADKANRERKLLLPGKCNLAKQPDGLAFTISGDPGSVCWENTPVSMHADDAIESGTPGPKPEARQAAETWLIELLANGPVPTGDARQPQPGTVRDLAKEAGMSWATIRRAMTNLGVIAEKDSFTGKYVWRLPRTTNNEVAQVGCSSTTKNEQPEQPEQPKETKENIVVDSALAQVAHIVPVIRDEHCVAEGVL